MNFPSSAPQTPTTRPPEDFDDIIRGLNHNFRLGIVVFDRRQSPALTKKHIEKAGPHAQRLERIHNHLRKHYFNKDRLVLDEILARFHREALAICPGVPNNREAEQLQELLLGILLEPPLETRSFQQAMASSMKPNVPTPSRRSPKRSSDESHPSTSPKKAKGSHSLDIDDSPLAKPVWTKKLSVGSADTTPAGFQSSQGPQLRPGLPSANTSRTTLVPDVFSSPEDDDDGDDIPGSQSTVEAGPEERYRSDDGLLASSPSSYDPGKGFVDDMVGASSESFQKVHPDTPSLTPAQQSLNHRLQRIWPSLPSVLNNAPLGVCWEVTRIALFCKDLPYSDAWLDQTTLRKALRRHPSFIEKIFPEKSGEDAWKASLSTFQEADGKAISLAVNLSWSAEKTGPLFDVSLQPLKLDQSHRLGRRFGADRFLDLNMPSPMDQKNKPVAINKTEGASDVIIRWVSNGEHFFVGRKWAAFYTRTWQKKEKKRHSDEEITLNFERVHCFAENGNTFTRGKGVPSKDEATTLGVRNKMKVGDMLNWMLSMKHTKNAAQPALKLFSRMALSLSKTWNAVVLEPDQIQHQQADILSSTGNVMNDGIARMSTGLMKKITEQMGLSDLPSAFQGRFGSAKGLWIRDTTDLTDDIWIETYPSQRKWECAYTDPDHRTFEVKAYSRMPKSADVNMQFIVVLCAQAKNVLAMRRTIADIMTRWLSDALREQRSAMEHPVELLQWIHQNFFQMYRPDRMKGVIDFLGGLPNKEAEVVNFLLEGGFHPMKLNYLSDICWKLVGKTTDRLEQTLKLRIPRSTYAFMAVDFQGVLKPGEVHFGFSSKFQVDGWSETMIQGMDVLVARAPAHFPSDIQRVRAVFRPELAMLKDVIIFPSTGDGPLADLLSGGDYDGDQAWVCWEPDIVDNFENAPAPEPQDFEKMGLLRKERGTFADVVASERDVFDAAIARFLFEGFRFNMGDQLLGMCTKFKEKYCYKTQCIDDPGAMMLSALLSALVDQAKQGVVFTWEDWGLDNPAYWQTKSNKPQNVSYSKPTDHLLDFLKFDVALPMIEKEKEEFSEWRKKRPCEYDGCLSELSKELDRAIDSTGSQQLRSIRQHLEKDLDALFSEWQRRMPNSEPYEEKVMSLYSAWVAISPPAAARASDIGRLFLGVDEDEDKHTLGRWAMLKASTMYRNYHKRSGFTWTMAGQQLQRIKATAAGGAQGSVAVVMPLYAVMRPDGGLVAAAAAAREGRDDEETIGEVDWDDETGTQIDDA
ncbi:RNA-dependent RNA polymerase [Plectosphaerella plurivora]|uniref:RNA-dependent RNA polymerase n=1 Tax=Plectosphaerella plurivora TaxID=936078 RepID=A0A9P8V7P4_9PEZI|nr:RNA-dependent RNA polymerase [Plectosphaerella plurivora]